MADILLPEIISSDPPPAQAVANDLRKRRRRLFEHILREFTDMRSTLWFRHDVTPDEILAELGPDAAGLLADLEAIPLFLTGSGRVALDVKEYEKPQAVTVEVDGTATVDKEA